MIRFGINEWNSVKEFLLKDFYVLTEWKPESDRTDWTCFVFFDPETEKGVLFAFRMEECGIPSFTTKLPMLDEDKVYELVDVDKGVIGSIKGGEELTITHENPRSASLIFIN